jgi:predicted secreted Zn-dependent protease
MKIPAVLTVCLISAMAAATALAGDDAVIVASAEKNLPFREKTVAVPPLVTERYEYYDVHGSCENDLLCELKRKGVGWGDGKRYESFTSWHVRWNYGYANEMQTCRADSFQVTVEIVFHYPKWMQTEGVPPPLADKWDNYMKHLIVHENGHRDMAVEAATDLTRTVSEMSPVQTCAQVDRAVQILSRARMNKLNYDERHYDEATNHGATQGAIFP